MGKCFNEERRKIKRKFTSDGLDLLVNFYSLKSEMGLPAENKKAKENETYRV